MESTRTLSIDSSKETPMQHMIHYNPEMQLIEIKATGVVNAEKYREIFSQGMELAKEKECFLFLNDFSEAAVRMSTMEIYDLPRVFSGICKSLGIEASRLMRAIVVAPQDARDASFAEDVIVNRGQQAKFFYNIEDARKWLLGK